MAASIVSDIIDAHCDVKAPVLDIAQQMVSDGRCTDNVESANVETSVQVHLGDKEQLSDQYVDNDSAKDYVASKDRYGNASTLPENEAGYVGLVEENMNSVAELPSSYQHSLDTSCTEYSTYNKEPAYAAGSLSADSYMPYTQPDIMQDTHSSQNPYEIFPYQGTDIQQTPVYYVENGYQQTFSQMNYSNGAYVPFEQYQPAYQYQTQYAQIPTEFQQNIQLNHSTHDADPSKTGQGVLPAVTQAVFVNCQQPHQQSDSRTVTEECTEPMAWSQGTPKKATSIDESEIIEMKNRLQQSSLFKKVIVGKGATVNATGPAQVPVENAHEISLAPPTFYQNVPPPNIPVQVPGILCPPKFIIQSSAAAVTTPSGEKLYIPLDDNKYELKHQGHNLDDIPEAVGENVFKKESELEGFSQESCSPRPVQTKGSISDEEASESDYLSDASRSATSLSAKSSGTCISQSDTIDTELKDNNDTAATEQVLDHAVITDESATKSEQDQRQEGLEGTIQECEKTTNEPVTNEMI